MTKRQALIPPYMLPQADLEALGQVGTLPPGGQFLWFGGEPSRMSADAVESLRRITERTADPDVDHVFRVGGAEPAGHSG